jgi:hypothetical protein
MSKTPVLGDEPAELEKGCHPQSREDKMDELKRKLARFRKFSGGAE